MLRKRGFTLIEVMTVVAIIGVLASLTGYVYSSSLSRTRDTQRLSDLRVVQGALEQFYTANRYYPPYKKNAGNLFLAKFQLEDFKVLAGCHYINYSSIENDFLVPRFLGEIPEDPHSKFSFNFGGFNDCRADPNQRHQYLYVPNDFLSPNIEPMRPNGFYLIARMERVNNMSDKVPELGFWEETVQGLSGIAFCDRNNHGTTCSHNFYLANSRND